MSKKLLTAMCLLTSLAVEAQNVGNYPVSVATDAVHTFTQRKLQSITLRGNSGSSATVSIPENLRMRVYKYLDTSYLTAKPGETLTPTFAFSTDWMHGYVYVDLGKDGTFTTSLNSQGVPNTDSDLKAYSYYNGKNSAGASKGQNPGVNPPAFVLPVGTPHGMYRMRYKVDWDNADAAGNATEQNNITRNGGTIVDVILNVHGNESRVTVTNTANGSVLRADGTELNNTDVPFGQDLELQLRPAEGYVPNLITIRHGHNLSGDSLVYGTPQYRTDVIPAFMFKESGKVTIPSAFIDGEVQITASFVQGSNVSGGEDYAVAFDKNATLQTANRAITALGLSVSANNQQITLADKAYIFNEQDMPMVKAGQAITPIAAGTMTTAGLHGYLYIDYNQDGIFSSEVQSSGAVSPYSELVSYTHLNGKNSAGQSVEANATNWTFPPFTLPAMLPNGVYRARFKFDENNLFAAGQATTANNGGRVVDFLLNVCGTSHRLELNSLHGNIYGANNAGAPAPTITPRTEQSLRLVPVVQGYVVDSVYIKHGHNLNGTQYVRGNRQWQVDTLTHFSSNQLILPASQVDGDVLVTALFKDENSRYRLIFSDEFNAPNGTQADSAKWERCHRKHPTWARFLSNREDVAYQQDGNLHLHAKPNDGTSGEDGEMVTGGVQSAGRFSFKYGKVECRALTNPHTGNFPAIWMMPDDFYQGLVGWPHSGEIDIWEAINNENRSYHTIHSYWANGSADGGLGRSGDPQKTFSYDTPLDRYHTYGLEWDENELRWFVDGKQVGQYARKANVPESQLQFPFRKNYYLILNQSVGNGGWAHRPDVNHTYTTKIDWIRVYQLPDEQSSIVSAENATGLKIDLQGRTLTVSGDVSFTVTDLSGKVYLTALHGGTHTIALPAGVYLVNGSKVLVP